VATDLESLRAAVDAEAINYGTEYYPMGTAATYAAKEDGKTVVTIAISASRFQGQNFHNGRWRSVWQCVFEGRTVKISGSVKIHIHYYEDGNVQLNTDFQKPLQLNAGATPQATASELLKLIQKAEAEFQLNLDKIYGTMNENTFKALRRILPMTKNKVDWEKIHQYKLGVDVVTNSGRPVA